MRTYSGNLWPGRGGSALLLGFFIVLATCFGDRQPEETRASEVGTAMLEIGNLSLSVRSGERIQVGDSATVSVSIQNPEARPLEFVWRADGGTLVPTSGAPRSVYHAAAEPGTYRLSLDVMEDRALLWSQEMDVTVVQAERFDLLRSFFASGWMGDGAGEQGKKHVNWNDTWREDCHSPPTCVKVIYTPGDSGWAGIYVQNRPNNWGREAGRDMREYANLVFWARADPSGAVEFKAGGVNDPGQPHRDSFEESLGVVDLGPAWQRFEIDLRQEDLSSVIGGFAWVARAVANPDGLTFFLDDVYYER